MGSQAALIGFVLACGFAAAGLLNALHRSIVVVSDEEDYSPLVLQFHTGPAIAWSMFLCVFAGPYLVLSNALHFWRMDVLPSPALAVCAILSGIWAFCSGVFIVEGYLLLSQL